MGDGLILSCNHAGRTPSFPNPLPVSPPPANQRVYVAAPLRPSKKKQLGRPLLSSSLDGSRRKLPLLLREEGRRRGHSSEVALSRAARVFLLDVNPLCYDGSQPSHYSFAYWTSLFLSRVVGQDPVVAVSIYPSCFNCSLFLWRVTLPWMSILHAISGIVVTTALGVEMSKTLSLGLVFATLSPNLDRGGLLSEDDAKKWVQLSSFYIRPPASPPALAIKVEDAEADDVIATLVEKIQQRGLHAVIASPDKDFKQLISEGVQMVMPMPELGRWSFYTLKHYLLQYNCDPTSDLSLRCILGDDVDGVPGLQHVSPGFGRKTAVKLIKKHGTLENLLRAAAIRTVGKPYAQTALTEHADYLRRNFRVLSLRRDVDIHFDEKWLSKRDTYNDLPALSCFFKKLN
ncbi:5'-3' exonuclease [Nymphaea thermarum]|nr:5'-3' exonuclease [Nymphaea thermarum]